MCGRYVTVSKVSTIEKRFNVVALKPELYKPNTNISTGELAPVITNLKPNELQFFQFGFTPSWANKQSYVINARSEGDYNKDNDPNYSGVMGISSKPMFRTAIRSQRCLVPADAFIEGPTKERLNKPYLVHLKNKKIPFSFAGIWDEWVNQESGEITNSFAIITTVANELMNKIGHHRSPVILKEEDEKMWLNTKVELSQTASLLKPFDYSLMNAYPISNEIKSPITNGIHLVKPAVEASKCSYDCSFFEELKLHTLDIQTIRKRNPESQQGKLF